MSFQNHNNLETERQCKIRKRGCSSSSSSSLVRKYRFKRAILVGKRGGASTTPVPTWKTTAARSPTSMAAAMQNAGFPSKGSSRDNKDVSARKLAATLWEINELPSPQAKKGFEVVKDINEQDLRRSTQREVPDPCHTPISERMDRSGGGSQQQRRISAISHHKLQLTDYCLGGGLDSISRASLMEIESHCDGKSVIGVKTRLKEVSNGLTTSKELLKLLNHVWGFEEQRSSTMSVVSALRVELDRARHQVDQLIREQRCNRNEIDYLMKHFAQEKAAWKSKERDRIRDAIVCIAEENEVEKKLRRQTERLNKKLGKELADTKASLSKAMKELEREKRAKEILEQICDELARGIGEDRAQVEVMKRESAKVREEVEKEREMLQLADVLREERVQMKLSEAKYHFEEKNAAVEKLRNELESYLRTKVGKENGDGSPKFEKIKELEAYLKEINFGSSASQIAGEDDEEEEDSAESDLHSIELNMDNNNRSYKWSYACGDDNDSKRVSVDKELKGRKSVSEKIQWGSICLNRENSINGKEKSIGFELLSQDHHHEDEIKRYTSVKSLRDRILSDSKIALVQSFASPSRHWGQSFPGDEAWEESSMVLEGDDLIAQTRGEYQT